MQENHCISTMSIISTPKAEGIVYVTTFTSVVSSLYVGWKCTAAEHHVIDIRLMNHAWKPAQPMRLFCQQPPPKLAESWARPVPSVVVIVNYGASSAVQSWSDNSTYVAWYQRKSHRVKTCWVDRRLHDHFIPDPLSKLKNMKTRSLCTYT